jgi:hypothetical protein
MDVFDLDLDDVVIFELPDLDGVEAFCDRLRPRWEGWSDADGDGWLVTATIRGSDELPSLLRTAEELVSELRLGEIRYCLDGRVYALQAARSADDLAATAE